MITIKGTRKKTGSSSYGDFIPFGADGQNIDMVSGLDLEQELKLGGDHLVSINKDISGNTIVIEDYIDDATVSNVTFYRVKTTISKITEGTQIEAKLYLVDTSTSPATETLKKTKTTLIGKNS